MRDPRGEDNLRVPTDPAPDPIAAEGGWHLRSMVHEMGVPQDPRTQSPRRADRRKLVSPDYLLQVLNQRLDAYGHCHSCRFAGPIRRLSEPEVDGRNWSRYIPLVCSTGVLPGCARVAERIISDAALEYNLFD